jgi:hypothetical protein
MTQYGIGDVMMNETEIKIKLKIINAI